MSGPRPDLRDCVVLFVDLHEHGLGAGHTVAPSALRRGVGRLAALSILYELPVSLSGMPLPRPAFIGELVAPETSAPLLLRTTGGAFDDPALRAVIAQHGRRTVLLEGVATDGAIVIIALTAKAAGHAVSVVVDACGGIEPRTEPAALQSLAAAGATLTSTWTLGLALQHDFAAPRGKEPMGLVGQWLPARARRDLRVTAGRFQLAPEVGRALSAGATGRSRQRGARPPTGGASRSPAGRTRGAPPPRRERSARPRS